MAMDAASFHLPTLDVGSMRLPSLGFGPLPLASYAHTLEMPFCCDKLPPFHLRMVLRENLGKRSMHHRHHFSLPPSLPPYVV
jgi:hypothetical protein